MITEKQIEDALKEVFGGLRFSFGLCIRIIYLIFVL